MTHQKCAPAKSRLRRSKAEQNPEPEIRTSNDSTGTVGSVPVEVRFRRKRQPTTGRERFEPRNSGFFRISAIGFRILPRSPESRREPFFLPDLGPTRINVGAFQARVAELADALDSGSSE